MSATGNYLYADILFIIDFSMDVVSLALTGKLTHSAMSAKRTSLAAALGAVFSVVLTAFRAGRIVSLAVGIVSSALMCLVSFGKSRGRLFITRVCVMWTGGFLLGGVMTVLSGIGGNAAPVQRQKTGAPKLFYIALLAVACSFMLFSVIGKVKEKKSVRVKISLCGKNYELTGFVDSGNLLKDPFSGVPVVILSGAASEMIFGKGAGLSEVFTEKSSVFPGKYKLRPVPVVTPIGEKLIPAVVPDSISVGDKNTRALVAPSEKEKTVSDGYDCIVPPSLL